MSNLHPDWPFAAQAPRRLVLKIGSNVLALPSGGLDPARLGALCASIAKLRALGTEVIVVSSGAVAAGRGILGLTKRPADLPQLQAVASIGQGALMESWTQHMRAHGLVPAQLLLTRDDMEDRRRYLNIRNALIALLQYNAIPVINENDTVTIDELKFGDNDMLSAMVAAKMDSDLLVIFSNVRGLMTDNPKNNPDAAIVPVVNEITPDIEALVCADRSTLGVGGMATKLGAARHANQFGVHAVIADGRIPGQLERIASGEFEGTWFRARGTKRAGDSRRHWISTRRVMGDLVIDEGAERAMTSAHKSLLAVGIRSASGEFEPGDVVRVLSLSGRDLGHGISNYDRQTIERIRGRKGDDLHRALGDQAFYQEVIHCDNFVES